MEALEGKMRREKVFHHLFDLLAFFTGLDSILAYYFFFQDFP